jgi:hypothetical protein
MADPSADLYAGDHSLHVSSGASVFPERVEISIWFPALVTPRQLIEPHVDTICASRGSDSYVPRVARSSESRNSLPGFAVV